MIINNLFDPIYNFKFQKPDFSKLRLCKSEHLHSFTFKQKSKNCYCWLAHINPGVQSLTYLFIQSRIKTFML